MRLTEDQIAFIRKSALDLAGASTRVRLFGSRLDDSAKGGDIDVMLELPTAIENPALLSATLSARISRALHGRKVDVLLSAPNLMRLPIHDVAFRDGKLL